MSELQPIETAPKDGRVIVVMQEDVGSFLMAWNPTATNHLFAPGQMGMWEASDRSMTWRNDDCGPTHWMPLPDAPAIAIEARQGGDGGVGSIADESAGRNGIGKRNFA